MVRGQSGQEEKDVAEKLDRKNRRPLNGPKNWIMMPSHDTTGSIDMTKNQLGARARST